MTDEIYYPEQVISQPIPGIDNLQGGFPQKIIASETISQSLNTRNKRIRGEYKFGQQGAVSSPGSSSIADSKGLVSDSVFKAGSYQATSQVQKTGTFSYEDISGSGLSFTLVRKARILITFYANVKLYADDPIRGYHIDVAVGIDGVTQSGYARFEVSRMNADLGSCLAFAKTYLLDPGPRTITMRWSGFTDIAGICEMNARGLEYCLLGS